MGFPPPGGGRGPTPPTPAVAGCWSTLLLLATDDITSGRSALAFGMGTAALGYPRGTAPPVRVVLASLMAGFIVFVGDPDIRELLWLGVEYIRGCKNKTCVCVCERERERDERSV